MYTGDAQGFLQFVQASPTAFHAVDTVSKLLREKGFVALNEAAVWSLTPGGKYYVTRNRSSVLAFVLPAEGDHPFRIVASHSDSPAFKLKPQTESPVGDKYLRLNVEMYGGMILPSWLDRPLSIAGRILVRQGGRIQTRLVDLGRDAVVIPNQPIHFCRNINDGYQYNPQLDMLPLYGDGHGKGALLAEVAQAGGVAPEDIVGSDLYLYVRTPGCVWGANNCFFSSSRIDDLECAFTSLMAFADAPAEQQVNVYAMFDNEEVGSSTKQGAASTFLYDVLHRIAQSLGGNDEDFHRAVASSFMVSADNAHAVHPNHPEHTDVNNCTYMNKGVVIKTHAGQKYTSDGMSVAAARELAARAGVPLQYFANRSDKVGGSTLGNLAMAQVSMNCVDIGLPQLAMHSCYETAGAEDTLSLIKLMQELYSSHFEETAFGTLSISK